MGRPVKRNKELVDLGLSRTTLQLSDRWRSGVFGTNMWLKLVLVSFSTRIKYLFIYWCYQFSQFHHNCCLSKVGVHPIQMIKFLVLPIGLLYFARVLIEKWPPVSFWAKILEKFSCSEYVFMFTLQLHDFWQYVQIHCEKRFVASTWASPKRNCCPRAPGDYNFHKTPQIVINLRQMVLDLKNAANRIGLKANKQKSSVKLVIGLFLYALMDSTLRASNI